MRGPPPLGPRAPPAERLAAFYRAMVRLLERYGHLALAGEPAGAGTRPARVMPASALHVRTLLDEAGLGSNRALVDALLAPLAPDVFAHQRASGVPARRIAEGLSLLARRVLAGNRLSRWASAISAAIRSEPSRRWSAAAVLGATCDASTPARRLSGATSISSRPSSIPRTTAAATCSRRPQGHPARSRTPASARTSRHPR